MAVYSSPSIPLDGLVFSIDAASSKCYSGTGTNINDVVKILSGTLINGVSYNSTFGGYLSFDGVNDQIVTSNYYQLITSTINDHSFFAWINPSSNYGMIINWGEYADTQNATGISISNGFLSWAQNGNATDAGNTISSFSIPLNKWSFVGFVRNSSNVTMYYNDSSASYNPTYAPSGAGIAPSNNPITIGRGSTNGTATSFYNGIISTIQLYNRALTASEVAQLYNATKDRYSYKEDIVKNGLLFNYDIASPVSYINPSTTIQSTINNYIGTLTNGPTYNSGNGGYLSFDGTNDYINIIPSTTSFTYNRSSFTVGGWTYMASLPTSFYGVILSKWNTGGGNDNEFILNTDDGNKFLFAVDLDDSLTPNSQSNDFVLSTTVIVANTWYYVVGTFENGLTKIYVNGILESSIQSSFTTVKTNLNSSLDIGRFGTTFYSTGRRGVVHFYNRALSVTEVLYNFNALRGRYGI